MSEPTSLESDRVQVSLASVSIALRWPLLFGSAGAVLWAHGAGYAAVAAWSPLYTIGAGWIGEALGIVLLGLTGAALQGIWLIPAVLAGRYGLRPVGAGLAVGALLACGVHLVRIGDELLRTVF